MSDIKDEDFLEDLEAMEAEADAEETALDEAELDELEVLRAERDEFKDRFMRALADAENARKRSDRDRREAENYGGSKLARDMLPVYDNLERAVKIAEEDPTAANEAMVAGLELTMKELLRVFAKHGIQAIAPQVGDRFDPQEHEAMFEAPLPDTKAGDIIQVQALGFMLHDRLLRPAKVGVSSNPAK